LAQDASDLESLSTCQDVVGFGGCCSFLQPRAAWIVVKMSISLSVFAMGELAPVLLGNT